MLWVSAAAAQQPMNIAPVQRPTLIEGLRDAYVNCVRRAWGIYARAGDLPLAAERAFVVCQTEENALYSTLASLTAIGPFAAQALLTSRAMVDQLKVRLKREMLEPAQKQTTVR
jgi:hypothetical protein